MGWCIWMPHHVAFHTILGCRKFATQNRGNDFGSYLLSIGANVCDTQASMSLALLKWCYMVHMKCKREKQQSGLVMWMAGVRCIRHIMEPNASNTIRNRP